MKPSGNYNKTQAYICTEDDADQILAMLGIYQPPVPTGIIRKIFKDATFDVLAFHEEALGFSYPTNGTWHVLINANLPLTAKRFTVFHEFYHMLHGKPGFCKSTTEGSFEETKANYFASCILMPARWVRKYWEQDQSIFTLAEVFDVSVTAAKIRLKGLEHYLAA